MSSVLLILRSANYGKHFIHINVDVRQERVLCVLPIVNRITSMPLTPGDNVHRVLYTHGFIFLLGYLSHTFIAHKIDDLPCNFKLCICKSSE